MSRGSSPTFSVRVTAAMPSASDLDDAHRVREVVDHPDFVLVARRDGDRLEADRDRARPSSASCRRRGRSRAGCRACWRRRGAARSATAPADAPAATRRSCSSRRSVPSCSSAVDSPSARAHRPITPAEGLARVTGVANFATASVPPQEPQAETALAVFFTLRPGRCRRKVVSSASWFTILSLEENGARGRKSQVVHNPRRRERFSVSHFSSATCRSMHRPTCVFAVGEREKK